MLTIESVSKRFRAGNYGVPFAFLLYSGFGRTAREWFEPIRPRPITRESLRRLVPALKATTVLFLIGHGAYGAFLQKPGLTSQYAEMGFNGLPWIGTGFTQWVGWAEIALGIAILVRGAGAISMDRALSGAQSA